MMGPQLRGPVQATLADEPVDSFKDDLARKQRFSIVRPEQEHDAAGHQKSDVNYRYAGTPEQSCGRCANFEAPGYCSKVLGLIRLVDTCDLWTPRAQPLAEGGPPGWEPTILRMKKHPEIDNPWALAHYMKNKGMRPARTVQACEVLNCECGHCLDSRETQEAGDPRKPWDETKHSRHEKGAPQSQGGEFAPKGGGSGGGDDRGGADTKAAPSGEKGDDAPDWRRKTDVDRDRKAIKPRPRTVAWAKSHGFKDSGRDTFAGEHIWIRGNERLEIGTAGDLGYSPTGRLKDSVNGNSEIKKRVEKKS